MIFDQKGIHNPNFKNLIVNLFFIFISLHIQNLMQFDYNYYFKIIYC